MDGNAEEMKWPEVSSLEAEQWGLTPAKLAEVRAELDDHLYCLAGDAGASAAESVKELLQAPATRRRLAGAHITDQVVATLNRMPSKHELVELAWLGLWYLLIMLSDQSALWVGGLAKALDLNLYGFWAYAPVDQVAGEQSLDTYTPWVTAAWLLQGVARAGFFASFGYSLWRAGKIGWGVLLARLLQLKLIHTVLVLLGCAILGNQQWDHQYGPVASSTNWPLWLGAGYISGTLATLAIALMLVAKSRYRVLASGLLLTALFLFPGGPANIDVFNVQQPLATEWEERADGLAYLIPATDPAKIQNAAENRYNFIDAVKDVEHNLVTYSYDIPTPLLGSFWAAREYNSWGLQSASSNS